MTGRRAVICALIAAAAVALLSVLISGCGDAQSQADIEARASWSPPAYGTPVVRYVLQHSVNGGPWVVIADAIGDTTYVLQVSFLDDHTIRVAGVDAQGRQGPYSLPSNTYNPSECGPGAPLNVTIGNKE